MTQVRRWRIEVTRAPADLDLDEVVRWAENEADVRNADEEGKPTATAVVERYDSRTRRVDR